ncbi:hypothetical protein D3C71_2165000 [compost metagenome]
MRNRETKDPAANEANTLINKLRHKGILVSRMGPFDNVLKIRPPLIFNRENADELLCKVEECLREGI